MALLIGDDLMEGTTSRSFAAPTQWPGRWVVSWMDGVGPRTLSRHDALTAITLAEHVAGMHRPDDVCGEQCGQWPFVCSWADTLGLTGPAAVEAILANQGRPTPSSFYELATDPPQARTDDDWRGPWR